MRLIATRQPDITQWLFEFLVTVYERQPQAVGPIVAERRHLSALYTAPNPQVVDVLRHGLDQLIAEMSPDAQGFGAFGVSSSILGLAIAVNNCLPGADVLPSDSQTRRIDPVKRYTHELIARIPRAKSLQEMLVYHSVLRDIAVAPASWPQSMVKPMNDLIGKSPLTTLTALDGYNNPELDALAGELLKARAPSCESGTVKRQCRSSWETAVERVVAHPALSRWLRRQWLDLPETRRACRNLGLILEMLRRKQKYRDFLLEFYEGYEFYRMRHAVNGNRGIFDVIEAHLKAPGSGDAALRLNRWGNEYFLKFLALIEIIIDEDGLPKDYQHLTPALARAIERLLPYATWNIQHRIEFTPVEFGRG